MKPRIRLLITLTLICAATLPSTGVPAIARHAENVTLPSDELTPRVYLPFVRYEYAWSQHRDWTPWAFEETPVYRIYSGPEPGWLWSITPDGLHRSTDYGRTWEAVPMGSYSPAMLVLPDRLDADAPLYVTTSYGTVLSSTNSITWTVETSLWRQVTFMGWVDGALYLAGATIYDEKPPQLFRRSPLGQWEPYGDPLPATLNDLAVFQSKLYAATQSGLYRLNEGTWSHVTVYDYALESQSNSVLMSSLSLLGTALTPASTQETFAFHSILVIDDTILVGTSSSRGLYRSTDGLIWSAVDVGITGPFTLSVTELLSSQDGRLYAATRNDGVFMSCDGGDRWMALDGGLPHSITAYDQLLDGISATALVLLRDEAGQQTLAASFNSQGVWLMTVTDGTWLTDVLPQSPPKAVLVVGPVDPPEHTTTKSYIAWADRLATIMERNGMQVVKVYWPYSTWENVRAAIGGASVIVYKGHGFGLGDIPADTTELYGSLNGFCLVDPTDPPGARLGTQDMLVTTNRLASNAIGFFFCCYCGGGSASDPTPVAEGLARRRIEAYASTVMRMGGGGYFASVNEESILTDFFSHPDKSLGDIYKSVQGTPANIYTHVLWPEMAVWFDGDTSRGWSEAFVGHPELTARDILGR